MGRRRRDPPRAGSERWPEQPLVDPAAEVVRHIALNLRATVGTRSIRSVARQAGVVHQAVADLLAGNSWPEVATVARLEVALGVLLWPLDREDIAQPADLPEGAG